MRNGDVYRFGSDELDSGSRLLYRGQEPIALSRRHMTVLLQRKCYLCPRNELLPICPEWTRRAYRCSSTSDPTRRFPENQAPVMVLPLAIARYSPSKLIELLPAVENSAVKV